MEKRLGDFQSCGGGQEEKDVTTKVQHAGFWVVESLPVLIVLMSISWLCTVVELCKY